MKTVLNTKKVDLMKQPMFLGEDLGLQRYDKFKYPRFAELAEKQWDYVWRPKEISLMNDRAQYANLGEKEKFIFDTNLRFQTMGDSLLSRSIHSMEQYVSLPELESCMGIWAAMEGIHSKSYTYILENVTTNAGKFFDSILEDKEIVNRASTITDSYNKLLGIDKNENLKTSIFKAVLSTQLTEGLSFYVSFICSFWFASRGIMVGNGDIIKLISRDENLHVAVTHQIMKNWKDREDEGFKHIVKENEQLIIDMYGTAVENEKKWAEYLFSKGDLLGLNVEILHKYSQWLANNRISSLGYKPIFDIKTNPLGNWAEEYFDSSKVQVAPQEKSITSYKIGALNMDIDEEKFSGIEL